MIHGPPRTIRAEWSPRGPLRTVLFYCGLLDPAGRYIHYGLALGYLFLLPLETTPKDIVWLTLALWALLRLPHHWHHFSAASHDRLLWLLAGWAAWHTLSLLWSGNVATGVDELRAFRVVFTPLLLWPLLERAPLLIGAFLAGVFCQNLIQIAQELELLGFSTTYERAGGLLHPIMTGAFCAAALCWHVSALLSTPRGVAALRPALLVLTCVGLAASAAGLLFSGSRGPWISAAVALPLLVLHVGLRQPAARKMTLGLAGAAVVGGLLLWPLAGGMVRMRVESAFADLKAVEAGDYDSDVGHRLARWSAAGSIFTEAPLIGAGMGGYGRAAGETSASDLENDPHAHSVWMHELATVGIVGSLLLGSLVCMIACRLFKLADASRYGVGTLAVLATWVVGGIFDAYHLNGNTFGLFTVIVSLALVPQTAHRVAS
ncbi:MAG: O-antigen ligase family protein [Planctomycetota bacterium]|jgi:O-antigen ligase